jgi:hypothetical protein
VFFPAKPYIFLLPRPGEPALKPFQNIRLLPRTFFSVRTTAENENSSRTIKTCYSMYRFGGFKLPDNCFIFPDDSKTIHTALTIS